MDQFWVCVCLLFDCCFGFVCLPDYHFFYQFLYIAVNNDSTLCMGGHETSFLMRFVIYANFGGFINIV